MPRGSSEAPIIIRETLLSGQPVIKFSKRWFKGKSCEELMKISSAELPTVSPSASVTRDKPKKVTTLSDSESISVVPSLKALEHVREQLSTFEVDLDERDLSKLCWITIGRSRVAVECYEFSMLAQIVHGVSFIEQLKAMDEWLTDKVKKFDANFETRWRIQLNRCTLNTKFIWFGQQPTITHVLTLAEKEWLNESIMDSIIHFFRHEYGNHAHGRHLFISMHDISSWVLLSTNPTLESNNFNWNWGMGIDFEQYRKVYAFVHMKDHWGAISIDFRNREIAFGDSDHKGAPRETMRAVFLWLEKRLGIEEVEMWNKRIQVLTTRRVVDGGSCGVIAALAIENDVKSCGGCSCPESSKEIWGSIHRKNAHYHRARYLKLLSGLFEPETEAISQELLQEARSNGQLLQSSTFNETDQHLNGRDVERSPSKGDGDPSTELYGLDMDFDLNSDGETEEQQAYMRDNRYWRSKLMILQKKNMNGEGHQSTDDSDSDPKSNASVIDEED
ncbi:hypothetical protein BGX34_003499, partial [Mortierella sp. NVP85]